MLYAGINSWVPLAELGAAEVLVEEAAEKQDGSDCQERERPLRRAEAREVEEEDLAQAGAKEDEAPGPQPAAFLGQADVERDQRQEPPEKVLTIV
jgi:hypothetical protein